MLLLLGLRRCYISGSKKRVKRLFLKGVKVCLIALFTEMLPRRFVARVPNKKPQNKTKSPSCRHSVQPQKFVEVIPRKLFKQSSKKRCVGKSGPLERIREEGAKQWTTHFPIPGSPIRASGSMLREAFSLLETKGVEQKCSSSLTVHLGHRPAPYGQYDTT